MIGDSIEIKVVAIEGDMVRIGIEAPRNIDVHRKEIYLSIKEENEIASQMKLNWAAMKQLMEQHKPSKDGE